MVKRKRTGICIYTKCNLNCKNEYHHRAKYAYISRRWKNKIECDHKNIILHSTNYQDEIISNERREESTPIDDGKIQVVLF